MLHQMTQIRVDENTLSNDSWDCERLFNSKGFDAKLFEKKVYTVVQLLPDLDKRANLNRFLREII